MTGPHEPTPASGDDIPDVVLRELRTVFADPDESVAGDDVGDRQHDERARAARPRRVTLIDDLDGPARVEGGDDTRMVPGEPAAGGASPVDHPGARPGRRQRRRDRKIVKKATKEARKAARKAAREIAAIPDAARDVGVAGTDPVAPAASVGAPAAPAGDPASNETVKTIVIAGGDDLPDALYLDDVAEERLRDVHGTPDPDRGGATIVIGDELDSSGAFDAVAVPTQSMDPRVRARRVAVKRAASRRRLLWVGIVALVVALVVGALAVFSSSLFAVEDVRIQGAPYTEAYDAEELQAVVDSLEGEPILLVDTLAAERRLERIAWIERAIVTTDFPHSVMIDVRERQPLAAFQGTSDGRYRIIDRDGRVLDVLDGRPADYMLVTGQAPDVERGALAGAPWASAAQMVAALPAEIRELTVSASVDAATGDLGLVLQPEISVRIGGFAGLDVKLARLLQLVRDGVLGIVAIDVSTPEVSVTRG